MWVSKEATVRTLHGKTDWFKLGKGIRQSYILSLCLFNLQAKWLKVKVLVTQPCPTRCNPMDCSLLGSSVHGILLVRILEWVAFSRASPGDTWPRDRTQVSWIMWNAGLDESQAAFKIARRNSNNLRYADDTTLMAESEDEQKSLLRAKKKEWKIWLKTQHLKN